MGANLVGGCILTALICVAAGFSTGSEAPLMLAFGVGVMVIPCSAVFRCDKGWPRQAMSLYCAGLALCGLLGFTGIMIEFAGLTAFLLLFALGIFLSAFVANGLMMATQRA